MAFQVLLFAALLSLSVAQLEVPGKLIRSSSYQSISPLAFTLMCDGVSVYSSCSDCNNVLVCLGSASAEKNCKVASPSTPFCVDGACSATPNTADGCFPPSLTCTGVGFYPDPSNCQIYHYCEGIDQDSSVYECAPNYVYNAATNLCKQKVYAADCVTVQCDQRKVFSNYGTSKQYFAYCEFTADVVTSISMLQCAPYSNFDGTSCVFTCPKAGNFQHSDATKYYQCYLSGGKFVYLVQSCTTGKNFDQERQVCITAPATTTTTAAP
ncbi:uncharacterized protein LOC135711580 [Ochlerotatus camptorhynchus]|uniref:uncharacterized protein LOC135711580 n=1 Tax=Ochlerotatus camptorhynchus TaxID=644619 RepID=UPI0031E36B71